MKKSLTVYAAIFKLNFAELLIDRASFVNSVIATLLWAFFSIVTVFLLTGRNRVAYGWTREELLILVGVFNLMISIFRALFARNMNLFSQLVHRGQLDSYLLKPIDSQFFISVYRVMYANFVRSLFSLSFVFYIMYISDMVFDIWKIFLFSILLLCGVLLTYSIWFMVITLTIWFTTLSNLVDLLGNIMGVTRFPKEMFKEVQNWLLLILFPLTLIVVSPTMALIKQVTIMDIVQVIGVTVILLTASRVFWKFALRYYTSASG